VTGDKSANGKLPERKKKIVELSEARKSLRRQRNILSGRAESLGKLNSSAKLSVYQESTSTDDNGPPLPNIYATLRKPKKKCKSLNGDRTPVLATSARESGFESSKGLTGSDSCNNLLNSSKSDQANSILHTHQLYLWLKELHMDQYKDLLILNGYDNLDFMVSSASFGSKPKLTKPHSCRTQM